MKRAYGSLLGEDDDSARWRQINVEHSAVWYTGDIEQMQHTILGIQEYNLLSTGPGERRHTAARSTSSTARWGEGGAHRSLPASVSFVVI